MPPRALDDDDDEEEEEEDDDGDKNTASAWAIRGNLSHWGCSADAECKCRMQAHNARMRGCEDARMRGCEDADQRADLGSRRNRYSSSRPITDRSLGLVAAGCGGGLWLLAVAVSRG